MRTDFTAIIHLREPARPGLRALLESTLRLIRGIDQFQIEPAESLITVQFDGEQTGLAEIVRLIEDAGTSVSSVAQRRIGVRRGC